MSDAPGAINLVWQSPGPVSSGFMASTAKVDILNGPVGSGKTTTSLMKLLRTSCKQQISLTDTARGVDGGRWPVRKTRWCVVRDTYRQLWKTTMPSWFNRIPRSVGEFTGAENAPASHRVEFALADRTIAQVQVDFLAIGDNAVEDVLRGYEPTGFYLNELDLLAKEVFEHAILRTGRFPIMDEGGPSWHGILADCNAPVFDTWVYEDFFTLPPEELVAKGIALFRQPGGRDPGAENVTHLPPGYYDLQAKVLKPSLVRRMVDNQPGYSEAGKPVYPEYNDALHVAPHSLDPIVGLPLLVGLDAGLNPAAIFGQRLPNGQWYIIDELVGDKGTGAKRFGNMLAQRLKERFGAIRTVSGLADPSAAYGADKIAGEASWIEIVAATAEIRIRPAPTNAKIPRWEAVRMPLSRLIDGKPGLVLSPRCKVLRSGFNAGYRFRKKAGSGHAYDDDAEKNDFSHPHDALQYLLSGGGEDSEIRERRTTRHDATRYAQNQTDWDPLALGR